ncbi:MAG: histidine triad nucleotide-binding protein [Microbacteriaceae bacterium]
MSDGPSIFTRIVDREIPADIVFEDDRVLAIRDIAPKAPVHVLVFPKSGRYRTVVELAADDPALLAHLVAVARRIADDECGGEFRLIFNSGERAGQTIFHVHAHVLGGHLPEGSIGF